MAEENIIMCCGAKIWTRVVGSLELVGCLLMACVGSTAVAAYLQGVPLENREQVQSAMEIGLWVAIALTVLLIVLLLVGNEKERAGFFIPFLVLAYISIVFTALGTIGVIISGNGGAIFGSLFQLALQILFVYAVHKRYKEVKVIRSSSQQQHPMTL